MSSKPDNWRVVVYPYCSRWTGKPLGPGEDECNRMRNEIMRHVDDLGDVEVVHDTVCADCESPWEEPPCCCDKAMDEYEAAHPEGEFDENGDWHLKAASHD